jgi:hypothetical protein
MVYCTFQAEFWRAECPCHLQNSDKRSRKTLQMSLHWILNNSTFQFPDLKSGTLQGSGGFTIFFLLVLMVLSVLMLLGVRNDIRGIIMPWIYAMYVVILFQAMFGLWLLFGYYIYLELVFSALCDFTWMGFNYYCVLVVKSHLRNLKKQQAPEIADIYDLA